MSSLRHITSGIFPNGQVGANECRSGSSCPWSFFPERSEKRIRILLRQAGRVETGPATNNILDVSHCDFRLTCSAQRFESDFSELFTVSESRRPSCQDLPKFHHQLARCGKSLVSPAVDPNIHPASWQAGSRPCISTGSPCWNCRMKSLDLMVFNVTIASSGGIFNDFPRSLVSTKLYDRNTRNSFARFGSSYPTLKKESKPLIDGNCFQPTIPALGTTLRSKPTRSTP
ncbi:hypothetical protein B0J18DRAFT_305669 [Chaetomium sp. MPI-SDFR-AT-0129]|nr:hypothetical protein B0J18DRAFT_305669 [Chaetomium sp. MPI-SDFR-AT-0129]